MAFDGSAYIAGTLGAGPTLTLPAGEIGLDAHGGLMLSTDEGRSILILRDLHDGAVQRELETGLTIDNGRIHGDQVYISARTADGTADAGVFTGPISTLELSQLLPSVPGGPGVAETRAWIRISPSGKSVASTVCTTQSPCATQVLTADRPVLTIHDFYVRWLADDVVVLWQGSELRAYSTKDGSALWKLGDDTAEYDEGYFLGGGETLILGWSHGVGANRTYEISAVNGRTGRLTTIATYGTDVAPSLWLQPSISDDAHVTLLSEPLLGGSVLAGTTVWLVDLRDGALRKHESAFSRQHP